MYPHQRKALDNFIAAIETDPHAEAAILGGSIAKGWHNETSDVDVLVLCSDAEYERRRREKQVAWYAPEFAEYEGGYLDIKYIHRAYLDLAAEKGNEPTRASFRGSTVAWSRGDAGGIESLIERITAYPEAGVQDRIQSYIAQVETMRWYIEQAAKRDDVYLAHWAASRGVLFGCRAVLALNRVLFPYHKWLIRSLELCEQKPDGFADLAKRASVEATVEAVHTFCDAVLELTDWPGREIPWAEIYIRDTEWAWMDGQCPLEDA